jgi:hypothetical protein
MRVAALGDEQLLAQNIPFCKATGDSANDAEFVQLGGYRTRRERLLVTVCNLTPGTD